MTFKHPARFALPLLCAPPYCHAPAATHSLNDAWSLYRDASRTVTSVDLIPAGSREEVNLPHAARLEPRVPTAPWQVTVFYQKQLDVHLRPGDAILSDTPAGGGVFVTCPRADQDAAVVQVQTEVRNTSARAQVVTLRHALAWHGRQIAHAQQQVRLAAGERPHVSAGLQVSRPQLWSPQATNLYDLMSTVRGAAVDTVTTRIGVRRLAFEGGTLLQSGAPLQLRGVNRHQAYPYVGYALSPQADYRDALLIKRYGFDYVRLSH